MGARTRQRGTARFALLSLVSLLSPVALAPTPLTAQPRPALADEEVAQRRLLLEQARAASDAGEHVEALTALQGAARIRSSAALQQFIAAEHQSLRHYAEGLRAAARCLDEAVSDPTTRNRDEQVRTCRAMLDQMRARVGFVVLHIQVQIQTAAPDDLAVTLDGQPLPRGVWGTPYAVDPGPRVLVATAQGYDDVRLPLTVAQGATLPANIAMRPTGAAGVSVVYGPPGITGVGPNGAYATAVSNCGELGQLCCGLACGPGLACSGGICSATTRCDETRPCATDFACQQSQCVYRPRVRRFVVGGTLDVVVDTVRANGATGFVAGASGAWRPLVFGTRYGWEVAGLLGLSARAGTWRGSLAAHATADVGVSARVGTQVGLYSALWYSPGVVFAESRLTPAYATYRIDLGVYVNRVAVSLRWQEAGRGAYFPLRMLSLVGEVDL